MGTSLTDKDFNTINPATKEGQTDAPNDSYLSRVAQSKIPGKSFVTIEASNLNMAANALETIWDYGGLYTYLTADTQLYVSSDNALDSGVEISITGLDANYLEVTRTVVVGGTAQVAISGLMFRVFKMFVTGSQGLVGELYLAETDTLTAGVPNTASKIKSYIPLQNGMSGNITQNGFTTIPAGKTGFGHSNGGTAYIVGKGQNILFRPVTRSFGGSFLIAGNFDLYQSIFEFTLPFLFAEEKTDIEFRGIAGSAGTKGANFLDLTLIDNV